MSRAFVLKNLSVFATTAGDGDFVTHRLEHVERGDEKIVVVAGLLEKVDWTNGFCIARTTQAW